MSDETLFRAAAMAHARVKGAYVEDDEVMWRCVVESIYQQIEDPMYRSAAWHFCEGWSHPECCVVEMAMNYSDGAMVCSELAMDKIVDREDAEAWALASRAVAAWLQEKLGPDIDNGCDKKAADEVALATAWADAAEHSMFSGISNIEGKEFS